MSAIGNLRDHSPPPSPPSLSVDRTPPPPAPRPERSGDFAAEVDRRIAAVLDWAIPHIVASSSTSSASSDGSKPPVKNEGTVSPPPGLPPRAPAFVRLPPSREGLLGRMPSFVDPKIGGAPKEASAGEGVISPPVMSRNGAEDAKQEGAA
jgi:hypothetical protein